MAKRLSVKERDVHEFLNKLIVDLDADKKKITEAYDALRSEITGMQEWAINGQTLAKLGELVIKHNAQSVEVFKALYSKAPQTPSGNLDEGDVDSIYDDIKDE